MYPILITKEEKKAVIKHYDKMIAWAETQDSTERPNSQVMLIKIGENWLGNYCPLCQKYFRDVGKTCRDCPLFGNMQLYLYEDIYLYCFGNSSYWRKLANALTWEEWLIHAKRLRNSVAKLSETD